MNNNIVFVGFMGVGKSTIAREISVRLNRLYLDSDLIIENKFNMKVNEIFDKYGEDFFRREENHLSTLLSQNISNSIISVGGGFFMTDRIKDIGKIIFLNSSFDNILGRLRLFKEDEILKRPLLKDLVKAREIYSLRMPHYRQIADIIIELDSRNYKQIIEEILKVIV